MPVVWSAGNVNNNADKPLAPKVTHSLDSVQKRPLQPASAPPAQPSSAQRRISLSAAPPRSTATSSAPQANRAPQARKFAAHSETRSSWRKPPIGIVGRTSARPPSLRSSAHGSHQKNRPTRDGSEKPPTISIEEVDDENEDEGEDGDDNDSGGGDDNDDNGDPKSTLPVPGQSSGEAADDDDDDEESDAQKLWQLLYDDHGPYIRIPAQYKELPYSRGVIRLIFLAQYVSWATAAAIILAGERAHVLGRRL